MLIKINFQQMHYMFSGRGSQYYKMGEELYQKNKIFQKWMLRLNDSIYKIIGESIIHLLYSKKYGKRDIFDRTLFTYPAIFMVQYSLAKMLIEEGVNPSYVLGTSLGEFAASAISQILDLEGILDLLIKQAESLEKNCKNGRKGEKNENVCFSGSGFTAERNGKGFDLWLNPL